MADGPSTDHPARSSQETAPGFWKGRKVTVTGGAGFLGSVVCARASQLGAEVTVVRSVEHDLRERDQAFEAIAGSEIVINLAAHVGGFDASKTAFSEGASSRSPL